MAEPGVPGLRVSGGAGGIDARYDDLERLGRLYADTGGRLAGWAWEDRLEAADGDLLLSGALAPASFAEAEGAILDATYGPRGLVVRAATIEAQSMCFAACVELYRTADEAQHAALEALSYGVGFGLGRQLPGLLLGGAAGYGALRAGGLTDAEVLALLEDHPGAVEGLAGSGGGLLDGMAAGPLTGPVLAALGIGGFHPDTGAAADDLGDLLFGSHQGELGAHPRDEFAALDAPADLGDLLDDLGTVADGEVEDGVFNLQRLDGPDGSTRWVVQLPGTDDFFSDDHVRNMGSNLDLVAGDPTAYADAVGQAMAAAGVAPDEPVLLVGHSQGGMQAAALAADPGFGYHVTDVVTAGSPVATSGVPADVTVLSLENTGDVVPLLDGEANPAAAHHTTVSADVHTGHLGAQDGQNHAVSTYGQIAAAAEASGDPSVQHVLDGLKGAGFLSDSATTSTSFSFQAVQGEPRRQ